MSAFATAFLAGEARARGFLALDFRDEAVRVRKAREAAGRTLAPALLGLLREQDAALPPSAARRAHLDALAAPGAAVVVTGQQVGLFLGPLYTFYKAASAIADAAALQRESGVRCVPLFWLQTEDHDFAEIDHCHVAGADGEPLRITLADAAGDGARTSIRHRRLGPEVLDALAAAERALASQPHAAEVLALLRAHYVPGRSLGAAFGGLLAELFADEGLVVLDPREAALARDAVPLYRRALFDEAEVSRRLDERRAALAAAGIDEQVHARRGCTLVCFHEGGAEGPRFRIERRDGAWRLAGGQRTVSDAELQDAFARDPLRFSTTALLRPLVQDALFPVAAYVGGPAEVSYFAQLAPLYELFGLPQPLPVPRARFRCLDAKTRARLDRHHLHPEDVERPWPDLARAAAGALAAAGAVVDPGRLGDEVAAQVLRALAPLEEAAVAADPTLARPAARTRASVNHAIHRLADKARRALVERDAVTTRRLERLQAALFPEGAPQERVYGWPSFAARAGVARFKQAVMQSLVPWRATITDVAL